MAADPTPLQRAATAAAEQHGHLRFDQLAEAGVDRHRRRRLLRSGALHHRWGDVVAVGHVPTSPHGDAMAAVLAGGPHALLAGTAAAAVLTDAPTMPEEMDVVVLGRRRAPHERLAFHRARVDDSERDEHYGIPVTRPERTALDCACVLDEPRLTRLVNELVVARRTSVERLVAYAARRAGAPGVVALRRVLDAAQDGLTRSPAEDALGTLLRGAGLTGFRLNAEVLGAERDCVFDEARVVVEVQSGRFHGTPAALEEDARRALDLRRAGWEPLAVTARMLRAEPLRALAAIVSAVAPRRRTA